MTLGAGVPPALSRLHCPPPLGPWPGALRGRLGAGVVAYVPLIRALVTLSRAPRETALFPVHCSHSSLPGRYASAAYSPACGGTTGNVARIPGGGSWNVAICCGPASSLFVGSVFRYGSQWFASGATCRPSRIVPRWHGMARYDPPGVRRYAPVQGIETDIARSGSSLLVG